MMSDDRLQKLIAKWDAGDVSADEEAELERLLDGDADARRSFARHFLQEAELYGALREADGFKQGEKAPIHSFSRSPWFRSPGQALVAGFLIMAMGGILFLIFSSSPDQVRVNDKELASLPNDAIINVAPDAPAILELPDNRTLRFEVPERPDDLSRPFFRMFALAQAQVPGGVPVEAEFERENGKRRFTADFIKGSKKVEVQFDADTRELLDTDTESADSKEQALSRAPIDLPALVMRALEAHRGMTVSAEVESRDGRVEAKVRIVREGELLTVHVDVASGKVVRTRHHELDDEDSDHDG